MSCLRSAYGSSDVSRGLAHVCCNIVGLLQGIHAEVTMSLEIIGDPVQVSC